MAHWKCLAWFHRGVCEDPERGPGIDELFLLIVAAYMHFEEVVLCCDVGVNMNQVGATKVGVAAILTCERGHISGACVL